MLLKNPDGNTSGTWSWAASLTTSVGGVGNHTFKANFTPDDPSIYNSKTDVDVALTVNKAANPATVTGRVNVIRDEGSIDLADYVNKNDAAGAVSYAFSGDAKGCTLNDSILTFSESKADSVNVNVTVAADNNYEALPAKPITVNLVTGKYIQTISTANVDAVYGGTDKTVSASSNGNGTISYAVKTGSENYIGVDKSSGTLTIKGVPANGNT